AAGGPAWKRWANLCRSRSRALRMVKCSAARKESQVTTVIPRRYAHDPGRLPARGRIRAWFLRFLGGAPSSVQDEQADPGDGDARCHQELGSEKVLFGVDDSGEVVVDEARLGHVVVAGVGACPFLDVGEGAVPADDGDAKGVDGDGQVGPDPAGPFPGGEGSEGHRGEEDVVEDNG